MANEGMNYFVSRFLTTALTAQNSCALHEQCDSTCPSRIRNRSSDQTAPGDGLNEVEKSADRAETATNRPTLAPSEPRKIDENTAKFEHTAFQNASKEIRLLKIKRAYFKADPVDCELLHFELDQLPVYGALSYCWSNRPDDCKILCNGKVVDARESLQSSLKKFRAGFRPGEREEYIWADAICIDQKNIAEKSEQIPLMEVIYSKAQTVYVNLGDVETSYSIGKGSYMMAEWGFGGMGAPDEVGMEFPFHYKTAFNALASPWFSRTWTVQELVFAKKIKFMFAGNVFDRNAFDSHFDKQKLRSDLKMAQELFQYSHISQGFLNYMKSKEIEKIINEGNRDSLKIIQLTRDRHVTEPKDMIYGIMAMLNDDDKAAIGPYTQSLGSVYRLFAIQQIRKGRLITILHLAGLQRRQEITEDIPSWVPDWRAQSLGPKQISALRSIPYSASRNIRPGGSLLSDNTDILGLELRGFNVGTLGVVVDCSMGNRTARSEFLAAQQSFRVLEQECSYYSTERLNCLDYLMRVSRSYI